MPRVKVRLGTGVVVPSRRRAGLRIHSGQAQEFDVTDDQYLALLDDSKLEVTEIPADGEDTGQDDPDEGDDEGTGTDITPTGDQDTLIDTSAPTAGDDSEGDQAGETDTESGEDVQAPAGGQDNGQEHDTVDPAANTQQLNDQQQDEEVPAIPSTPAAIKKQKRDVVVAQAKSLDIDLDYEDEKTVTKSVIADAIVAKQKKA